MSDIKEIRQEIDNIDDQILKLLNKRAEAALKVKQTSDGKSAIRADRQNEIIRRLIAKNIGPLPDEALENIYTQLIASFRDHLQLERPISVSFLGPKGTYSEEAAKKLFGDTIDLRSEDTIGAVIRSVEAGTTQLAVVPVENSSEGAVRETHRQLLDTNVKIVSEISIPIVHSLLSKDKKLTEIKQVYAHPQALGQCRTWLATHLPNVEQISVSSNSAAADLAKRNKNSSAIASKKASELYGLNILESGINDVPGNETRFIALGNLDTKPTGNDKTSMICVVNEKPGALHEMLGFLAEKNISMTRLESQPYGSGQYAFYIDFIGHRLDLGVEDVLNRIDKHTKICKILGSYPSELNKK